MSAPRDPVEEYLDLLFARLRGSPRQARRILAEAEDHLREAVADGLAAGMSEREAQEQAVSGFGSVRAVVRAHEARRGPGPAAVLADLAASAWMLAALGLLAVGASGLVAAAMNATLGRGFVGGAPSAAGITPAACRHYLAVWPGAHSCAQAAMLEISADAVSLRLAAGAAGLALLAGYLLARRRLARSVLPDGFVPTVAVGVFGAAGAGLAWMSTNPGVAGVSGGPGLYLSGAIVALAAAAAAGLPLRRSLLRHARG